MKSPNHVTTFTLEFSHLYRAAPGLDNPEPESFEYGCRVETGRLSPQEFGQWAAEWVRAMSGEPEEEELGGDAGETEKK